VSLTGWLLREPTAATGLGFETQKSIAKKVSCLRNYYLVFRQFYPEKQPFLSNNTLYHLKNALLQTGKRV
jgi:hypothetical protein